MRLIYTLLIVLATVLPATAQSPYGIQSAGDITQEGLAMLWSDVDGDDDTDLLMVNVSGVHALFRNDGTGGLDPEPFGPLGDFGLPLTTNVGDGVFADLDGDGDRDLILGSLAGSGYYENQDGDYVPSSVDGLTNGFDVRSVNPVDVNRDGRLDLFVSRRGDLGNYLLTQTASGGWDTTFIEPAAAAGSTNQTCWSDADLDGDLDAFVVNSVGAANVMYRNDDGTLVAWVSGAEQSDTVAATSCAWGDVDADGDFDLLVTAAGSPSRLYVNDGEGLLTEAAASQSPDLDDDVISARWDDIDLDGDLDLLAVGRFAPLRLFLNEAGSFSETVIPGLNATPPYRTSAATFDLDGDGDLELAVGAGFNGSYEPSIVYRNDLADAPNWLGVRLESGTTANTDGIGARVTVFSEIGGEPVRQVREILAHSSRLAQSDMTAMVGLGQGGTVDSVRVDWPNGAVSTLYPETTNQVLLIKDPTPVGGEAEPLYQFGVSVRPNPSAGGDAVGLVTVEVPGDLSLALFDVLGRQIWTREMQAAVGEIQIPLPRLAAGTYVFQARSDRRTVTRLLTIAR